MKNISILYEDNFILVVDKPAGLAVQGGKNVKSSLDRLLAEIRTPPPLLVHRLDKDTSGLILTAKTKEAAARFSGLIAGRSAKKQYTAVCSGHPLKEQGVISLDIEVHNVMKKSETRYKRISGGLIDAELEFSVLELELGTGRMHQIRKHLAMTGNPILGDDKYGDFALNKKLRKTHGLKRLLLHATRLVIKGEYDLDIASPLPEYFKIYMDREQGTGDRGIVVSNHSV
jgi:23S rRNA pseudouridine955/2504/2580 synthase